MNIPFEGYLRHKDSREAADAGLLLWRENFASFILFFAIPFWVCAFALRLLPGKAQYFSWLILWLLKPLFDRPVLHIISVRFFESGADMKRLLHGMGKSLYHGLLGDLLWRRFSPFRAAAMPVRVLEPRKETGNRFADRIKLLKKGGLGYCFLLSCWGVAIEIALLTGEIFFLSIIMSDLTGMDFGSFPVFSKDTEIYIFAAWCFNYMLVETIYVCKGFSLYINSRIEVEGWDIEVIFRGFAEKLRKKKIGGLLIVLCLFCLFLPVKSLAAEEVPLEKLQNILESRDFGREQDSLGIRLKNTPQKMDIPDFNIYPMLEKIRLIFAYVLRSILIIFIAALALFLFLYARKLVNKKNSAAKQSITTIVHGIPAENPQALLEKAIGFFEHGNLRMAWGYCTAAAILSWPLCRGVNFPPNATESDCADIVSSMPACGPVFNRDEVQDFCHLIKHWVNFAYAGRLPPPGSFEGAAAFCKSMGDANE
jgi:hypothetical protein